MKQLQKSDLKEGEIYTEPNNGNICMWNKTDSKYFIGNRKSNFKKGEGGFGAINNYRLREATPEEKHWLETCIKENKFISYEEAMKTFIPEYVECIKVDCNMQLNNIYKVTNSRKWHIPDNDGNPYVIYLDSQNLKGATGPFYLTYFKPSTKEAYDAQFVVKKPEIILEEPKDKVLGIDIDTNENKIVEVESSEGGVFKIGDKITVFDKNSPNKGKPFTITGFRWNNAKTEICVGTELHKPYGIRLSKIELYVEPKVKVEQELSLLEQAKLKYIKGIKIIPIGAMFEIKFNPIILNHNIDIVENKSGVYIKGVQGWIFSKIRNEWAEIVDDFVLPEKWCVEVNQEIRNRIGYCEAYGYHHSIKINNANNWSNKIKEGFTEITFEQFKKYVLKDE